MSRGRIYTVTSALVAYTGTSATPILYGSNPATSTMDLLAIRIGLHSGGGVSYPANGTVLAQLARVTGTVAGGSAALTPTPVDSADIASQASNWRDGSTAITGLTQGAELWGQDLPFTAGANWAEYFGPDMERRIPASGLVAVYLTASAAGTATQFKVEIDYVE